MVLEPVGDYGAGDRVSDVADDGGEREGLHGVLQWLN